ncbi:MAG: hypothetical protein MUC97_01720 [Bernardetiaceae bacterium]|jgi:hypothetical protein|nr:hypothetical protein [Bernardetiaceae bacterium]
MDRFLLKIALVGGCLGWLSYAQAQPAASNDEAKVQNVRVLLNEGNKYTATPAVQLKIEAMGARQVMVSQNEAFAGAEWKDYQPVFGQINFDDKEGEKKIYVKIKDKYGNVAPVVVASIIYDRTPPKSGAIEITVDGGFVNNPERLVTLELNAANAKYMQISNNAAFREARWQAYRASVPNWKLEGGTEGIKKVYVKFRDGAGNETASSFAEILVDAQPPVDARVSINSDQKVTTDRSGQVKLGLMIRGGQEMKISEQASFAGAEWQPFKPTLAWTLSEGQGEKTIYVKYRDQAQNESEVAMDKIILDNQPPQNCSLTINNGAKYAEDPDKFVELRLMADGATFMMISNTLDFAGGRWEAYRDNVPRWRLSGENGEKTVYVRFKDEHGNETGVFKATIILAI